MSQLQTALMKAWRVHAFGAPEVMRFEDVPRPTPGLAEVLVRVKAAGVGPWDGWIRSGKSALPQPLPLTLGSDLAGDIVAIGPGVSGMGIGDKVYGVTNSQFVGAHAEYAVAAVGMLAPMPAKLSYVEAASVPVIAVTAWQSVFDQARLKAGDLAVIHGAAGNVGAYALQIAHRAGIRTIATATAGDMALVRDLGADKVVNFQVERFEDVVRDADAVIDLVGGHTQRRSFQVLRRGGRLISTVSPPDQSLAREHGIEAAFFLVNVTTRYLIEIGKLIDAGELRTRVGSVLPFADARSAHRMLEGQIPQRKGKIVLATGVH